MARKILVVDDEQTIVDILSFNLKKDGYDVIEANDGESAVEIAQKESLDLILLDVMLPGLDGFEACRKIRSFSQVPIIMLTARDEEVDKVLGLEFGADDYMTKPFSIRELMARVKSNLRRIDSDAQVARAEYDKANEVVSEIITEREIAVDPVRYEVRKGGNLIDLTLREFEILKFMITTPEKIYSRETLLEKVWGYEYYGDVRTVDVTVRRLREKIEDDASNPTYIITKRSLGYYFAKA